MSVRRKEKDKGSSPKERDEFNEIQEEARREMIKRVFIHYGNTSGEKIIQVITIAKNIEVQLISEKQKGELVDSCKVLAVYFKTYKNYINQIKQSNTIPNVDEALDIINSVITKVNDLTACMQKSSISTNQYLEYETAVSNFKQELSHLKNFLILSPKQQLASFKLIFNDSASELKEIPSLATILANPPDQESQKSPTTSKLLSNISPTDTSPVSHRKSGLFTIGRKFGTRTNESDYGKKSSSFTLRRNSIQTSDSPSTTQTPPPTEKITEDQNFLPYQNLFDAAANGDIYTARALRKKGLGINARDNEGWSALHHAAKKGDIDMASFLIQDGIKLDIQSNEGLTALDIACLYGHEDLALYLVSKGIKFDMFSKNGMHVMSRSNFPRSFWETLLSATTPISSSETVKETPVVKETCTPTPIINENEMKNITGFSDPAPAPNPSTQSSEDLRLPSGIKESLQEPIEQFTESLQSFTKLLSKPEEPQEDRSEKYEDPLMKMAEALKNMLPFLEGYSVPFKPFHDTVLVLAQSIKQNHSQLKIASDTVVLCTALSNFYHGYCLERVNEDSVLEQLHNFLSAWRKMIKFRPETSFPDVIPTFRKLLKFFFSLFKLRLDNSNMITSSCYLITQKVDKIRIKTTEPEVNEVTKSIIKIIKELVQAIQSPPESISSVNISSISLDTSLQDANTHLESIIQKLFHFEKFIPPYLEQLGRNLSQIQSEIKSLSNAVSMNRVDHMIEVTCQLNNTMMMITRSLHLFAKGHTWSAHKYPKKSYYTLLRILHFVSVQMKIASSTDISNYIKKAKISGNFGNIRNSIRVLPLALQLIFHYFEIHTVEFPNKMNPQHSKQNAYRNSIVIPTPTSIDPLLDENLVQKARSILIEDAQSSTAGLTIRALGLVKLFKFVQGSWTQTNIEGILSLLQHKATKELVFQITDLITMEPVFLLQITPEMNYQEASYYFHRFFNEKQGFQAFSFLHPEEASALLKELRICEKEYQEAIKLI